MYGCAINVQCAEREPWTIPARWDRCAGAERWRTDWALCFLSLAQSARRRSALAQRSQHNTNKPLAREGTCGACRKPSACCRQILLCSCSCTVFVVFCCFRVGRLLRRLRGRDLYSLGVSVRQTGVNESQHRQEIIPAGKKSCQR